MIGSGTMATGIIEVFAKAGYEVVSVTRGAERSAKLCESVKASLNKARRARQAHRGGAGRGARAGSPGRRRWTTWPTSDLVVEAVVEELSVKTALFASLDEICKPGTMLATTTSSLPVIECAVATGRPADVVGLHFFNPAPVMELVEVVHTIRTAPETVGDRPGGRREPRQARRGLRRPGRLRGQRAAVPVPERRGTDGRGSATPTPTTSTTR